MCEKAPEVQVARSPFGDGVDQIAKGIRNMPPKTEDLKTFEQRVHRVDPEFKPTKRYKLKKALAGKLRMPWLKIAMIAVFCYGTLTVAKVVMENELGPDGFDQRVANLAEGDDTAKIAAKLLWRDPVMAFVQDKVL
ncbi:hypothetical protein [Amylibacter sp. IMCC11727]|uniref:hypothetical protein n=1 Tax=Amylibacter sp. IMCC11727 TaxID=3039851 RepID=UPI00244E3EC7|nr:hypothetical protein [Amylibacter sp. IMCC11727]WGI22826.1 hypothetical protein QBD29_05250 [Amylibacter sp. IMCC11727]